MGNDSDPKKDLTGIFDLQKLRAENPEPMVTDTPVDPFAVNDLQKIEQVDSFESIEQIGMMDHPSEPSVDPIIEAAPETAPLTNNDPFAIDFSADPSTPPEELTPFNEPSSLNNLKNYSEQSQGKTNLEVKIHYPFHLKINGTFGPFERDKLLMFITENPIGLSSEELDLQIQAGKVFFPRISEFSAVKLVQELRDSGLTFILHPSDREPHEVRSVSTLSFHYENADVPKKASTLTEVPILNSTALTQKNFQEIDEVSMIQYVRTEVLEVENSPMIQEVIERMTESLKQKARLKGGNALTGFTQEILPMRLPSQYQISLKASVIKV